jgi:hypothetical protein
MRHHERHLQRPANAGESLSSCHVIKQRLINSLRAEIHESAAITEGTEVTPTVRNFFAVAIV